MITFGSLFFLSFSLSVISIDLFVKEVDVLSGYAEKVLDGAFVVTGKLDASGDMYVAKYSLEGVYEWFKRVEPSSLDPRAIAHTNDNGFVVTGKMDSDDLFLSKFFDNGTLEWSSKLVGDDSTTANGVFQTSDGCYLITGTTNSFTVPDLTNKAFLVKFHNNGTFDFGIIFYAVNTAQGYGVIETSEGDYIISGYIHYDGNQQLDILLIKVSPRGEHIFSKYYGGGGIGGNDKAYFVKETSDNNLILVGTVQSVGVGAEDAFLIKTDLEGEILWANAYGRNFYQELGMFVVETSDNGFMLAGTRYSGNNYVVLTKVDMNGNIEFSSQFGGTNSEYVNYIHQDVDGNYLLFGGSYSFGSSSVRNLFVANFKANGNACYYSKNIDDLIGQENITGQLMTGIVSAYPIYVIPSSSWLNVTNLMNITDYVPAENDVCRANMDPFFYPSLPSTLDVENCVNKEVTACCNNVTYTINGDTNMFEVTEDGVLKTKVNAPVADTTYIVTINATSNGITLSQQMEITMENYPPYFARTIEDKEIEYCDDSHVYDMYLTFDGDDKCGPYVYDINDTTHFEVVSTYYLNTKYDLPIGRYPIKIAGFFRDSETLKDVKHVVVTVKDSVPPVWDKAVEDQKINGGEEFRYQIEAHDPSNCTTLSYTLSNNVEFEISNDGLIKNKTNLGVGEYTTQVSVSDGTNIISATLNVVVDKKLSSQGFSVQMCILAMLLFVVFFCV